MLINSWQEPTLFTLTWVSSLHNLLRCFNQITSDYLWLRVNTEIVFLLLSNESCSQTSAGSTCNIPGMSSNHPDIALDILLRQGVDIRVRLRLPASQEKMLAKYSRTLARSSSLWVESSLPLVRVTSFQPAVVRSRKASKASGCGSSSVKLFTICDRF